VSMLALDGLAKAFGRHRALDGITLDVRQGELLALLGPTGAGKTTTLRCVAGLERPDAGRIRLAGVDVTDLSPMERDVSIVFEGFNLLPVLSVYDNIAFPLRSPLYREAEEEVGRRVRKAATDLRIGHLLDRGVDQLSGGEKQRVAIARALVRRPSLYMLDEPLSALDLKLRESLMAELREMHQRDGATILYATHDYNGAAAVADRVALLDRGRLLQVGPLTEIMADPASLAVGRLIGSPAMACFPGRVAAEGVVVEGWAEPLPAADPAWLRGHAGQGVVVGLWPDDIAVSAVEQPGFTRAEVYATDFRGLDRALELQVGRQRFRIVVDLGLSLPPGASCWFRLPAQRCFLFDADGGRRLRAEAGKGGRP